ncbi:hypothetical protein ACHHYP_13526 [Achlya hypogyna]|uniref:DDE-1 domain-containing protein n=1 Tax=Achlya hypogyna TaxID=1202772 RepID=A0A1V9YF53_ACHHY|nr:hypothetical protein ACHHYP_13526 [Achlya hypogyna]
MYLNAEYHRNQKHLCTKSKDIAIPFGQELVTFMKDLRREERILTTAKMVTWISSYHAGWLEDYMSKCTEKAAYNSLLRLLQRFAHRHGFVQRVPCVSKLRQGELDVIQAEFALAFWTKYELFKASEILNVDETAIDYDMPPHRTWAEVGKSSKVDTSEKHSDRLTAVLTIRADGYKLPVLFIVHGKPGGLIERNEIPLYPPGHHYVVQEDAWMDSTVWHHYLIEALKPQLEPDAPSVIIADNLRCHVSEASVETICTELCCDLAPLPENSTGTTQPLDVGAWAH